jgi:hypothetical protein
VSYRNEQPIAKDLLDVILQASQKMVEVDNPDGSGSKLRQPEIDSEIIWWKTLMVNANTLGRFAFKLKEFERLAFEAFQNMSADRARDFAHTVIDIGSSYRRSIDAKSSESMRDKDNSQSTMVDKINRSQVEKIYTAKGQVARGVLESFIHKDKDRDDMS